MRRLEIKGVVIKNENKKPAVDAKNQSGLESPPAKTGSPSDPSIKYKAMHKNDSKGPIMPPIRNTPMV